MSYRPSRRSIIVSLVVCGLLVGFTLILPEVARRIAVNRLQTIFTVPVAIDNVDINLFSGRAIVESLRIGQDDPRPILSLPAVTIDFSRANLLIGRIRLQSIVLQNPQLLLERLTRDSYNILRALRVSQESEEIKTSGVPFTINHLAIHGGEIEFIDYVQDPDYRVSFSSLEMAAGPISALPEAEVTPTNFNVGLKIADGTFKLAGSTTMYRETLEAQMTAEIANVELEAFQVYLPYGGRLNLQKSALNGKARYVLASREGKTANHSIDGNLNVGGIALLSAPQSPPIAEVAGLRAQDIHIDLRKSHAQIGVLAIDQPYLLVQRDSSGFNLEQLLPETPNKNLEQTGRKGIQMPLVVKRTEAKSGIIEFTDQTVNPAVKSLLQDLNAEVTSMEVLPTFAAEQITVKGQLGKGSMDVTGAIQDEPLKGEFSIVGKRLPFLPYSGYLNQLFSAANSSGDSIDGELKLTFAPEDSGEIVTSISGHIEGHNMGLEFPDKQDQILATERLRVDLKTIRLGSSPRVDLDQITFSGANLRVVRNKDNTLNLARLLRSDEEQESKQPQKQREGPGTILAIRSINVEKSSIDILDRRISPNYSSTISSLSAKLSSLMPSAERAELNLQGVLGKSADLELTGWFTPFAEKPHMELQGTIRRYDLPPLNPYATEYVSHRIRRGDVTTDVNYTLKGDEFQATAEVVLRDLRVGEDTGDKFERRIGIPLELAIALLQDVNGLIRLQVDMNSGTGPQLNIASLVWGAVRNAILKAIRTPFSVVGKILTFGGRIGRVQIEPILFEPGTRQIESQGTNQLANLTELLKEKPRLELRLNGSASKDELDRMKKQKFWEELQTFEAENYEKSLIVLYQRLGGTKKPKTPLAPAVEESLERFILERIEITEEEIQALSRNRAKIVKNELQKRGIDPERLIVSGGEASATDKAAVEIELVS